MPFTLSHVAQYLSLFESAGTLQVEPFGILIVDAVGTEIRGHLVLKISILTIVQGKY